MDPLTRTTFDPDFYRGKYPDISGFDADQAWRHYDAHGRGEGRQAAPLAVREAFLEAPRAAARTLEIGPFCNPVLTGPNVKYLDVLDAAELRARAAEHGLDPARCPERIDYVGALSQVGERFDAVVSSHAIEHQPDFVRHLGEVADVLAPGGRYYAIVPDKRFCFDHFIPESTIAGIVAAHREERRTHSLSSVIEHIALTTHNDCARHWRGDHGAPLDPDGAMRVATALERHDAANGGYIDVHAWYFTPDSFRAILETLFRLRMTRLRAVAVYDTPLDRQEFCAVLEAFE